MKGLARAVRHPAVRTSTRKALSRALEEELFRVAEVLTEGSERDGSWFGSTMVTFDLGQLAHVVRETPGEPVFDAIEQALTRSVRVHIRVMRMAREEVARRLPSQDLGTAIFDLRVSRQEDRIHLDADIEIPLQQGTQSTHGG